MNDEIIKEKSWFKRNRMWLVPVCAAVFMFVLIFASSDTVTHAVDFASGYNDKALYENAIKQANANNDVLDVVGKLKPVDNMAIVESTIEYSNNDQSVSLSVRVSGSKGKAKMDVAATKRDSIWQYSLIKLRIKNPKQEIIVLE